MAAKKSETGITKKSGVSDIGPPNSERWSKDFRVIYANYINGRFSGKDIQFTFSTQIRSPIGERDEILHEAVVVMHPQLALSMARSILEGVKDVPPDNDPPETK